LVTIEERRPEIFYISSQIVSKNINFKKLFNEWDDFKQEVIKSHNISGVAQANVRFEAPFDLRSGVIFNSIKAQVGIQVDNGRLKNVETFKSITKSLRETSSARMVMGKDNIKAFESKLLDLKFEQLSNTLVIRDGVITIPSMSIESSALTVKLSGKHTFTNKIDYRFGFRFRDLKAKKESEFGEIVDDGSGKFVFMRMYGDLNNPNIEWDKTTNKAYRKENNEIAKQDVKSILKTEFGLFKNDTTVKTYIEENLPHEEFTVYFNPVDQIDTLIEITEPKKETKFQQKLRQWKKEAEEERKEEFDFEDDDG